ncbi:MAG: DUF4157 domain-containing protein [Thermosynechococcaceae cyanobacterium]
MTHQCKNQTKTLKNDRTAQATAKAKSASPAALHPMLHLQRQMGNQAVGRLIQAKLTVGEPNDVYEQEADRVAAEVVRQIHSPKPPSTGQAASVQRQTVGDEEEKLQTKPLIQCKSDVGGMAVSSGIESSIQQARGSGQPLAESIRTPMEQAFGADFSGVRVHTDERSDRLNREVGARAFTTGQDVFFRQGEYSPGNRSGQELIAHELTHVVQQESSSHSIQRAIGPGRPKGSLVKDIGTNKTYVIKRVFDNGTYLLQDIFDKESTTVKHSNNVNFSVVNTPIRDFVWNWLNGNSNTNVRPVLVGTREHPIYISEGNSGGTFRFTFTSGPTYNSAVYRLRVNLHWPTHKLGSLWVNDMEEGSLLPPEFLLHKVLIENTLISVLENLKNSPNEFRRKEMYNQTPTYPTNLNAVPLAELP